MEDSAHSSVYSLAERTVHVTFCLEHVHGCHKPAEQFFSQCMQSIICSRYTTRPGLSFDVYLWPFSLFNDFLNFIFTCLFIAVSS